MHGRWLRWSRRQRFGTLRSRNFAAVPEPDVYPEVDALHLRDEGGDALACLVRAGLRNA